MLGKIKSLLPQPALNAYHHALAWIAAARYGFPSEQMQVIGVTGTNGKSTVCSMIGAALEAGGYKVGVTTTAIFKIAEKEWLNNTKMTMLGRFQLQAMLAKMVQAGCTHAVVETSSQGIEQFRHIAINYDTVVFTNLTPEHIEAHGGFENYKRAKLKLFTHLTARPHKTLQGKRIPKTVVVNGNSEHAPDFAHAGEQADQCVAFQLDGKQVYTVPQAQVFSGAKPQFLPQGRMSFEAEQVPVTMNLLGIHNVENALAALAVAKVHGVPVEKAAQGIAALPGVPGRLEFIRQGQPFTVLVDYAPEPYALATTYAVIDELKPKRLIHVLGSCGGGRDIARRPILGRMAAEKAAAVVITNEDPYDDNPQEIIEQVAAGAREVGKVENESMFCVVDRREALRKALQIAQPGDLVLATGKGSEQAIVVADGQKLPWDERTVLKELLKEMGYNG